MFKNIFKNNHEYARKSNNLREKKVVFEYISNIFTRIYHILGRMLQTSNTIQCPTVYSVYLNIL